VLVLSGFEDPAEDRNDGMKEKSNELLSSPNILSDFFVFDAYSLHCSKIFLANITFLFSRSSFANNRKKTSVSKRDIALEASILGISVELEVNDESRFPYDGLIEVHARSVKTMLVKIGDR